MRDGVFVLFDGILNSYINFHFKRNTATTSYENGVCVFDIQFVTYGDVSLRKYTVLNHRLREIFQLGNGTGILFADRNTFF